ARVLFVEQVLAVFVCLQSFRFQIQNCFNFKIIFINCVAAQQHHLKGETSGLFKVRPGGATAAAEVEVYCQQDGLMGGWLLVQQRAGGALDFNRTWAEYRDGFGSVDAAGNGELWLGNKHLHLLTNQGESLLRVELQDGEGGSASAEYVVRVGSEDTGFPLHVSAYSGDAGDALAPHTGRKFSTYDRDNDRWGQNCAATHGAGWWYDNCQHANANANDKERGGGAAVWTTLEPKNKSVKRVRMFVRPSTF
uniref:Fibrinogen C-terminal domain-containing protein n=1 Tax=Gouania willdenowi TaxID=441366 RepID=A0A8C5GAD2_GOUWI